MRSKGKFAASLTERKIILVVDEDEAAMDLLEPVFNSHYRILQIPHGGRALEFAENERIALVVLSQYLSDRDGLEILKTLRLHYPSLPVIFAADAPTADLILSAFRSGASDFVKKPFAKKDFIETINRFVNWAGKDEENAPLLNSKERTKISKGEISIDGSKAFVVRPAYLTHEIAKLFSRAREWIAKNRGHKGIGAYIKNLVISLAVKNSNKTTLPETQNYDEPGDLQSGHQNVEPRDKHLPPQLRICCLGKFRVMLNDQLIEIWSSRKGKAVFAYLAVNHKRRINRDILMDIFWPNSSPESARNSLNVALHSARRLFYAIDPLHEYILFKDECYFINPDIEMWLDMEEFLHFWRTAQSTEREKGITVALSEYELAAALYKGDFMEEFLYESWSAHDRENLKEIYLVILDRISKHYSLNGKPATAINLCETILEKDNCREDIYRRLMRCYYRSGQRDKALKQFRRCAEVLKAELEVEPTHTTIKLYEQIKQDSLQTREKNK